MFDNYIGIPFKDRADTEKNSDCFGLVRLIYKQVLKIEVFKPNSSAFNSRSVLREFLEETSRNWDEVKELKKFDVIAMAHDPKLVSIVQHFGVYIGNGKMIHTLKGIGSHISNIHEYEYFIRGYYRHKDLK